MGIGIQIRTVDVELRQIQNVPVRVLAGGHDAGNHIRFVHVVGNAGQVLLFPDGHVGVIAHAPDQKHIVPVTSQLRAVLAGQPVFAQEGFHGIGVFPLHVLGSAGQIGIKRKIMAGQARPRQVLNDGSPHRRGRGFQGLDHVVEQIVENVAGIDRDFVQFWDDAIDAEGLISQLSGLDDLIVETHIRLYRLGFRALEGQILRGHIAVLTVRSRDFIPTGRGFVEHDDLAALFVLAEDFVVRPRTGAQMQRPALGRDLVDLHVVGAGLVLLRHQIDAGCHGGGHRRTEDTAL